MNKTSVHSTLLSYLENAIKTFPDVRTGANVQYKIRDIVLGAFSVFFMGSPSFLGHQRHLQTIQGKNNAKSLFDIDNIPTPNWIRKILDEVEPEALFPVYHSVLNFLVEKKIIDQFRFLNDSLLIALDGTDFFNSNNLSCDNCFNRTHKDGTTEHMHKALTPTIVAPGLPVVIPLPQEHIKPQDGHDKQDCENTAAKRWFIKHLKNYLLYGKVIILGDDLYSNQPVCKAILDQKCNYILTCKEKSHKYLYEWVNDADPIKDLNEFSLTQGTGKKREVHTYRFMLDVPIHGGENALNTNWVELKIETKSGKRKHFAFVTDLEVNQDSVPEIIKAGRTRWKIENENNNILKNNGYHLEHNFGHGEKNLSNFLLTLNILAYLFHTTLSFFDRKYTLLRDTLMTRKTFLNDITALTRYMHFSSWLELLDFMIKGLELEDPG